jgi:hypothetical protein
MEKPIKHPETIMVSMMVCIVGIFAVTAFVITHL